MTASSIERHYPTNAPMSGGKVAPSASVIQPSDHATAVAPIGSPTIGIPSADVSQFTVIYGIPFPLLRIGHFLRHNQLKRDLSAVRRRYLTTV
jgi:hypothetical protein